MTLSIVEHKKQKLNVDQERCVTCLRSAIRDAKAGAIRQLVVTAVGFDGATTTYRALSGQDTPMVGSIFTSMMSVFNNQETVLMPETEPDMDE